MGADPFDPILECGPLAPKTVTLRVDFIHAAVTALVASGVAAEQITSLSVLVTSENFKLILRGRSSKSVKSRTPSMMVWPGLACDRSRWVKPAPRSCVELTNLSSRLPTLQPGLTEKNKVLLRAFDDENLQSELLTALVPPQRRPPEAPVSSVTGRCTSCPRDSPPALLCASHGKPRKLEFVRSVLAEAGRRRGGGRVPSGEMKNRRPYQARCRPRSQPFSGGYGSRVLSLLLG